MTLRPPCTAPEPLPNDRNSFTTEAAVDRDTFMSSAEAVTFGLIDRVIEKREPAAPGGTPSSPLP